MNRYEAPKAEIILFELSDIIAASELSDFLVTWGNVVDKVSSSTIDKNFYE